MAHTVSRSLPADLSRGRLAKSGAGWQMEFAEHPEMEKDAWIDYRGSGNIVLSILNAMLH